MRKLLICVALLLGTTQGLSAGLVGYWPLDGNPDDASGNNNNGTIVGSVTPSADRFGETDGAMQFTGAAWTSYINVGNSPVFELSGAMTITAWLNLNVTPMNRNSRILAKMGAGGSRSWSSGIEQSVSGVARPATFQVAPNGSSVTSLSDDASLPSGEWVHYAGVYTPGVSMQVYLNGDLAAIKTDGIPASQYSSNGKPVYIGARPDDGASGWYGSLDEVRLYDEALTESQIEGIMALPEPATVLLLGLCALGLIRRSR